MNVKDVKKELDSLSDTKFLEKQEKFGINTENAKGIPVKDLRKLAKEIGSDHKLALQLWKTEIHEARILATIIADPEKLTDEQMEEWVTDINSWDLCDYACNNIFRKTKNAVEKAEEWSKRDKTFVKRTGFALIATLATRNNQIKDRQFTEFLEIIEKTSDDKRHYVKKAATWAIKEIGKRNTCLKKEAIKTAKKLERKDCQTQQWIAKEVIKSLK